MSGRGQDSTLLQVAITGRVQASAIPAFSDCVCHENTRSQQSSALEPQRISRTETGAHPPVGGHGIQRETAVGLLRLRGLLSQRRARNAPQSQGVYLRTISALLRGLRPPRLTRRLAASGLLEETRPDVLPRDHIGRASLLSGNTMIEFLTLRISQRQRIPFQALPHRVQQLDFLSRGEGFYLIAQIVHLVTALAAPALQHFHGLVQLIIYRALGLGLLLRSLLFIFRCNVIV